MANLVFLILGSRVFGSSCVFGMLFKSRSSSFVFGLKYKSGGSSCVLGLKSSIVVVDLVFLV